MTMAGSLKVYAQHDGMEPVFLCQVETLAEADAQIAALEEQWQAWHFNNPDNPPTDPRVAHMEGSGIYAEAEDGTVWVEIDPGHWEKER